MSEILINVFKFKPKVNFKKFFYILNTLSIDYCNSGERFSVEYFFINAH